MNKTYKSLPGSMHENMHYYLFREGDSTLHLYINIELGEITLNTIAPPRVISTSHLQEIPDSEFVEQLQMAIHTMGLLDMKTPDLVEAHFKAKGFFRESTGGGCDAFRYNQVHTYVLVSDEGNAPKSMDATVQVGLYVGETDDLLDSYSCIVRSLLEKETIVFPETTFKVQFNQ